MFADYRNVCLTDGYWKKKEILNLKKTIPAVYERFVETGRIAAFKCDWEKGMPNEPHYFWDSDVAKWMEAASYALYRENIPDLEEKMENLIDEIEKNQDQNGYFNIYFTVVSPQNRFKDRDYHELYCAGHLMEAACAYYNATGKDRFLKLMEKYADHIAKVFMEEKSAGFVTPGHEEIELALFKMYRVTGKKKYYDLARFFLENRGQPYNNEPHGFGEPHYAQSHAPIRLQHEAFGHSVRATYLYSGMADLARETGDQDLFNACLDLFRDITRRKMYITGGIGSTNIGESFTVPYDLPNNKAYTETCASIGMMFFANRMLMTDPLRPSIYADIVEREMYNGMISALSLDGEKFFYENVLESYQIERERITATNEREDWPPIHRESMFWCSCCPPNITRILASLGEYFYSCDEDAHTVYLNQFGSSTFEKDDILVTQHTDYPCSGKISVNTNVPIFIRIPEWCHKFSASKTYSMVNGYARFDAGDIELDLEMIPELVATDVRVIRNISKAALRRGPIVYCAEAIDNGGDVHTMFFNRATVKDAEVTFNETFNAPIITVDGLKQQNVFNTLYAPLEEHFENIKIKLIPYSCFANRGECDMVVFMNYR